MQWHPARFGLFPRSLHAQLDYGGEVGSSRAMQWCYWLLIISQWARHFDRPDSIFQWPTTAYCGCCCCCCCRCWFMSERKKTYETFSIGSTVFKARRKLPFSAANSPVQTCWRDGRILRWWWHGLLNSSGFQATSGTAPRQCSRIVHFVL